METIVFWNIYAHSVANAVSAEIEVWMNLILIFRRLFTTNQNHLCFFQENIFLETSWFGVLDF